MFIQISIKVNVFEIKIHIYSLNIEFYTIIKYQFFIFNVNLPTYLKVFKELKFLNFIFHYKNDFKLYLIQLYIIIKILFVISCMNILKMSHVSLKLIIIYLN